MELQFPKTAYEYLRRAAWEIKNEEQTQEVKLNESMPDIGRVLAAWGQPLVRSKEWRGSSMGISGGVMAWVLYAPEDGTAPRSVETWIPFQMRWDFPQTQRDGAMRVSCRLGGVDARLVSARKLMVRTSVSAVGEALEPSQAELYQPVHVPEDVQLLHKSYPVRLPREAGEKVITMDEELTPDSACGQIQKLIRYTLQPELADQKVMADKAVFRGNALLQVLCECADGTLRSCEYELPFSQYAELEREYDPYATVEVIPAVTDMELDIQENGMLRLKAGIVGQYLIYDRPVFEVVEDAYSLQRPVTMQVQRLQVPAVLDTNREMLKAETAMDQQAERIADISFCMYDPVQSRTQEGFHMHLPGSFQFLAYDESGNLSGSNAKWEGGLDITAGDNTALLARSCPVGSPQASVNGGISGRCSAVADMLLSADTDIPMVTALELGDAVQPDTNRPSLILRRVGEDSLWDMAKACGSTVEAIRQANALTEEPSQEQILLVPVP